jgi:branched-chain amino acid transport system permease protein
MTLFFGGLASGAVYAFVALGVVLVVRATGVVNFAQGEFLTVGAYAYIEVAKHTGAAALQLLAVFAVGALAGALVYLVTHFLLGRSGTIEVVIGTLAVSITAQAALRQVYSDNSQAITPWLVGSRMWRLIGTPIPASQAVLTVASVIVTLIVFALLRFTLIGKSMVAVAEDRTRAALTGVPVASMLLLSWALGGAVAAIGGMLVGPSTGVYPEMGANVLLGSFVAALLGGFSSIPGALFGGLLLGLAQVYVTNAIGGSYEEVVVFVIVIAVLLIRPTGLVSARSVRRF